MNENRIGAVRRAMGLTVAAGAVVAGTTLAVPVANAATSHQSTAGVLKNITQAGTGADSQCTGNGICNCPKPNTV
ncbi:hypothetical protein SAMN05421504_1011505 [Amycolatopsis xylanica]|uniref:Small secreted domain n=1 Tax=Amycolatopsis xylanica TaxID=589385 RepID=A0A1H2WDW2_9PSEU|nr:hypothetical protein [Amycolatopsis xylanica]SDW78725.1 hypothetical protein SAMN05421504_1011505 [Amycolatopsis xylanica]